MSLWLLGGLDPTGGAGVLRDFATANRIAPSLPVHCVVTAWTRQGTGAPAQSAAVDSERLVWQLRALPQPQAVKIGLVPAGLEDPLLECLAEVEAPIVLDPVLRASDGGVLGSTPQTLERLIARATLVTPNLDEAAALVDAGGDAGDLLVTLRERFPKVGILLKGGHAREADCVVDRLSTSARVHELVRPRWPGPDPRGTGCALATAIACHLAQGESLEEAVSAAVSWLDVARRAVVRRGASTHLRSD